jgi:hypothetical protein
MLMYLITKSRSSNLRLHDKRNHVVLAISALLIIIDHLYLLSSFPRISLGVETVKNVCKLLIAFPLPSVLDHTPDTLSMMIDDYW